MSKNNPAGAERPDDSERREGAPAGVPPAREPQKGVAPPPASIDEPPPFLGSWRNVYRLVLGELAVLVILFYALTRWVS